MIRLEIQALEDAKAGIRQLWRMPTVAIGQKALGVFPPCADVYLKTNCLDQGVGVSDRRPSLVMLIMNPFIMTHEFGSSG